MSRSQAGPSQRLPLLGAISADDAVVWRSGIPVSRRMLLWEARRLAKTFPDRAQVVNTCADRSAFLVGFLAAMIRGQVTLLPNERNPRMLASLVEHYPDAYCLADESSQPVLPVAVEVAPVKTGLLDSSVAFDVPKVSTDRLAAVVFTSGSTGHPVPHPKSWGSLVAAASLCAPVLHLETGRRGAIVATVPPGHMYGLETSIMVPLFANASVHAGGPSLPGDIEAALRAVPAPRVLVTTPVHLRALVALQRPLPEVAAIVSATAPLSTHLAQRVEERSGAQVFEIYGCSEAGTLASRRTLAGPVWSTQTDISLHRDGDVCVAEASHLPAPVSLDDDIDLLSPHEFILRGRRGDIVKVAGKRASLSGLNAILTEIDGVLDGTFFMTGDGGGDRVTRPVVFVVAPGRSAEDIRNALRQHVDPSFIPRRVFHVSALPRNEAGKLPHVALAEFARALISTRRPN